MDKPFDSAHFYFSRAALNTVADEAEAAWIGDLHYEPGKGVEDELMRADVITLPRAGPSRAGQSPVC